MITEKELRTAFTPAGKATAEGALTTSEWAERTGRTEPAMRKLIEQALGLGLMERTRKQKRDIAGTLRPSPAYRWKKAVKK